MRNLNKIDDGRTIIAREVAQGPHPHPSQNGRMVPYTGISKLLLDDGTELFECDECGKTNPIMRSISGHRPTHNPVTHLPDYSEEVLKTVLREAAIQRRDGTHRGYAERTAARLNQLGIKPYQAEEWTPAIVSRLVVKYRDKISVRIPRLPVQTAPKTAARGNAGGRSSERSSERASERASVRTTDGTNETRSKSANAYLPDGVVAESMPTVDGITNKMIELANGLGTVARELGAIGAVLRKLGSDVEKLSSADSELLDKAARWDALREAIK